MDVEVFTLKYILLLIFMFNIKIYFLLFFNAILFFINVMLIFEDIKYVIYYNNSLIVFPFIFKNIFKYKT